MSFVSLEFLLFFPLVTLLYFLTPHKLRWLLLVAAGCVFYMAFIPRYVLILFFLILVDFAAGLAIERAEGRLKTLFLALSLAANLSVLFVFKYFDFFLGGRLSLPFLSLVLPLGLSFHTFQSLSYVIEVYLGTVEAERHLGRYAAYVMFYPQLVAGPIERPQGLLRQLRLPQRFDFARLESGLRLMGVGFFKKMAIADNLAPVVNQVFANPSAHTGTELAIAAYFFSFQILADFSGYTDIARGAARTLGIELVENFKQPYFSRSVAEFWNRWHVSLSSWFRDYVYVPLSLRFSPSRGRLYLNVMIVFLLSGLWHGANWTYLVWGGLNGAYLVLGALTLGVRRSAASTLGLARFPRALAFAQVLVTFHAIHYALIFFRARSVNEGVYVLTHQFSGGGSGLDPWPQVLLIPILLVAQALERRFDVLKHLGRRPWFVRLPVYAAAFCVFAALTISQLGGKPQKFIYFQF